jgi:uncharacterized membrane protein
MNIILRRVVWILMLAPAIYLAVLWKQIPQTVPMHFDIKGNIDRYGSKNELLVLVLSLTVLNAIVYLVVTNIYKIDPKKYAAQNKERIQRMAFSVSLYLSAVWMLLVYEISHSNTAMTMKFVFIAMGLLFALLGNNMYNIKPNYFAGIRLPWTLENEENWKKTHQLAGRLWFFGGLFFASTVLFLNNDWAGYTGFAVLAVLILIPVFYSYNLYRNQTKHTQV